MPRKKRSPIDELFYDRFKTLKYRWEFVRRNADYAADRMLFLKSFGRWFTRRRLLIDECTNAVTWYELESAARTNPQSRIYFDTNVQPYFKAFRMKWGVRWPCSPTWTVDYREPNFSDLCPCIECPRELRLEAKIDGLATEIRDDSLVFERFVEEEITREWRPFHEEALERRRRLEEKDPFIFAIDPRRSVKENLQRLSQRLRHLQSAQHRKSEVAVRIDHCEEYLVVWDAEKKGYTYSQTINELIRRGVISADEYREDDEDSKRALNQRIRRARVAAREYVAGKFRFIQLSYPLERLF